MDKKFPKPTYEQAIMLLSFLPQRPDYRTWLIVVSVIANYFDSVTAEMILKTRFSDEVENEHCRKIIHKIEGISFGALVNIAKDYGFKGKNKIENSSSMYKQGKNQFHNIKPINLNLNEYRPYFRFNSEILEEIASTYQYDHNQDRFDVEQLILSGNPDSVKERIFRLSVNRFIKNKNCNSKSGLKNGSFHFASNYFINENLSSDEIISLVGSGFAVVLSNFNTSDNGYVRRNSANWIATEMMGIDIDGSMTIEAAMNLEITKKALFLYTTVNNTAESNRFRIIFDLPLLISDIQVFYTIINSLIKIFNADKSCKDVSRIFFGNNNTTVYNIRDSKLIQFQSGNLINEENL